MKCLYILLLLIYSFSLSAQPLCTAKKYSLSDGYLGGAINDMLQDRKGLIWISTHNGLIQFDGYNFINIKSYPGDESLMGSNNINTIVEDSQGDIWCKNQDGRVYLFDVRTKTFFDVLKKVDAEGNKHNDTITNIFSIRKGVTWLILKNGKCFRVDDVKCKTGQGIEQVELKGNIVYRVYQDSEGDEWVLTNGGVSILGKKHFNDDKTYIHLVDIKNSGIWLSDGKKQLVKYEPSTGTIKKIKLPSDIINTITLKVLNDSVIALGTTGAGLYLYNIINSSFRQVNVNTLPNTKNNVFSLYQDAVGDLWMTNHDPGIIHYEKRSGKVTILQSPVYNDLFYSSPNKSMIREDKLGNIWAIPRGGNLCYFDRDEQTLKYYYTDPNFPQSIVAPFCRFSFSDKQGNIWIDTGQGLIKLSFFEKDFRLVPNERDEYEVRSILENKDRNVWVGIKNSRLKILDSENNLVGYVKQDGTLSSEPVSFGANVYCMMEDKAGNIWAGSRTKGIYKFLRKNNQKYSYTVQHYENDTADIYSLSSNNVYSIVQDNNGKIWIGTYGGGINLVEEGSNGTLKFINFRNQLKGYPIGKVSCIRCMSDVGNNIMLVGTTKGLVSFSSVFQRPEEIKFYINTQKTNEKASLVDNDVFCVYPDKHKNIFVLTNEGGVNRVISKNLLSDQILFDSFTEKDGLLSDQTLSMIEDKNDGLWLISRQVLSKYFPDQRKIEHFNRFLFLQNINYSEGSPILNAQGNLVIGTDKGVLEINPYQRGEKNYIPSIIFTECMIQGERSSEPLEFLDKLVMKANQRNLSIKFAALDYRDPQEIQYAYKMEGVDNEWNYAGRERSASYINLSHGKYHLLVKSTNCDGVWVNNVKTLAIEVKPKFLETIWAWLLIVIIAIGLMQIVVYVIFTFYRLRHEVKMEQKISELKLNFFTEVSHELRTPLTLISSPITEVLENESLSDVAKEHLSVVKKNTDRMLRMINQILDFRKIQYQKMKLLVEQTEIVSFISCIMDGFVLMAKEKEIEFRLDSTQEELFLWVDKDKFEKIIFNLLSNAFKYTLSGKSITVCIRKEADKAVISVVDEGIGILGKKVDIIFQRFESLVNKEMLNISSGIGLSLVKELVEMHHATIEVFSQPEKGSEFKMSFLFGNQHFQNEKRVEFILDNELNATTDNNIEDPGYLNNKSVVGSKVENWSILIVEDNSELRRFLYNILSPDFMVIEALNGLDGLEKAQTMVPDIIVSDVMMPVKDGLEMVKEIKESQELCHIPIIFLSAKSSIDDRIEGLGYGIDDYITKPFSSAYLKARIRSLLENRKLLQELYMSSFEKGSTQLVKDQLSPTMPHVSSYDNAFIQHLMDFMEENMDNPSLSVDDFVAIFSMSRTVFFKKMKMLLGMSPVDFIRDIRVKRAVQLLDSGITGIADVAFRCGFSDPNYFAKCFKKQVGVSPSEYKKRK